MIIAALRRFIENRQNKPSLPPGPVLLPLLGNILSINAKEPWLTYTEWCTTYGDLVFVQLLGQEMVVINSQHTFHFDSALKFCPMQIKRAREMIINLIDDPQHYHSHFATLVNSCPLSAVYNYEPSARDDPMVRLVDNSLELGLAVMTLEKAITIKTFPFLLKLPDWCWGSSIKRDAQASTNCNNEMVNMQFWYAQWHMVGIYFLCFSENLRQLEKQDDMSKPMFETALKRAGATAITTSTLMVFVLAMLIYPDVQKHAQAEIDSVIGRDRLPTFEERASLPYIDAILQETFDLAFAKHLHKGLPHATSSEDIYDGYFIPKGVTVICNTWGISQDEKCYPNASCFIPERFIDVNDDPAHFVFGFGWCICSGWYAADASLWSAIVTILATLDISSAKDDQGNDINFTSKFTTGLSHISTRSHIHSGLVDLLQAEV
ncbi:cytochrome P450 [Suillus spraguei]|nr:cytochrome P450 [Suillus spraguei]